MNTLSRFQFNAILRAGMAAAVATVGSLGFLGGNVSATTDFSTNYLYNNAVRDTRGFTAFNSGGGNPSLDSNGDLAGPGTLCLSTAPSSMQAGPLAFGNYWYSFKSPGQATNMTAFGGGQMTVGTPLLDADGVTKHYPITINAAAGTAALNFDGPATSHDCARDGSATSVGQPEFASVPIAHYAQFGTLRAMDFLLTNNRSDTSWSTRPADYYIRVYTAGGSAFPWSAAVKFFNAVAAYPGSALKNVLINIPYSVDDSYAPALAQFLTAQGLTSGIQLIVQLSNEHWNTSFTTWGAYQALAMTELQYIGNYGTSSPAISSVTSDGTNLTFTTAAAIGSYLTTTANCVVVGGVGGFNVGTLASPVVATKTGSNTFTVPSTGSAGTGQFGVIFNLASTLIADGELPGIQGSAGCNNKWFVRRTYQLQQQWIAYRPQDKFMIDTSLYGGEGFNGNQNSPIEYAYAAYLGGGSASSWLYAGAVGWYVSAASNSTTDAVFADLNTKLAATSDGQIRAHRYLCKLYGLHPIAYECGPDLQNVPALQVAVSTDPRMQTFVTAMMSKWFSNGGEIFAFYYASPAPFINGNSQGAWSALQSFTDTSSPKIAALLAYRSQTISYANVYGAPGASLPLSTYCQYASTRNAVTNGLLGWYDSPPNYADIDVAIPVAGSYKFTVNGCAQANRTVQLFVDPSNTANGTLLGTSTIQASGSGWNVGSSADAVAVPDPVTAVSLAAGIHTIRVANPSAIGQHGIGLTAITVAAA